MNVPLLVTDFFRRPADLYPDKLAVVDGDSRFSYAQFQSRAHALANALSNLRLSKGDRVCYLGPIVDENLHCTDRSV